jgi:hypothetical protein
MITKAQAVASLRPGAQWSMADDVLDWLDKEQTQPTEAEIQAEVERLESIQPKLQRIEELKQMLLDTDYKVLPDYDKPDETIVAQRQAWRQEIRSLEKEVK